jgi:hypothetical protein
VNVRQYLAKQNVKVELKRKQPSLGVAKWDNFVLPEEPVRSKADIMR